jgi:hypothetical protein
MKIGGGQYPDVDGNRYRMLAVAVSRETHISLVESLSLTLVEAYLSLGANFRG